MNENENRKFYLHNLFCYICTSYYFKQIKHGDKLCLESINKFNGDYLLNLVICVFIYNKFRQEYKIEKSECDLENTDDTGGWSNELLTKWDTHISYFGYYDEEKINERVLYSEYLLKGYPCVLNGCIEINDLRNELTKSNLKEKYGDKYIIDKVTEKGLTIDFYIENMNKTYFLHERKDNMELNFFHTYYTPPEWYLKYHHQWGAVEYKDDKLSFEKTCIEKEDGKILLLPNIYIGSLGSGTYFETSPGFIDTLVYGKRRWFIYDPNMYILIYNAGLLQTQKEDDGECGDIEEWLNKNYNNLEPKPYDCIQSQGETIYIPTGWYCMSMCLKESIGIRLDLGMHKLHIDNFFKTKQNANLIPTGLTLK